MPTRKQQPTDYTLPWSKLTDAEIAAYIDIDLERWYFDGWSDVCVQATYMSADEWSEAHADEPQDRWVRIYDLILADHGGEYPA